MAAVASSSEPNGFGYHEDSRADAGPSIPKRKRKTKTKSKAKNPNSVRSRPANESVLASMIDALGEIGGAPAFDTTALYERVEVSRVRRPDSSLSAQSQRPSLTRADTWSYLDNVPARPPALTRAPESMPVGARSRSASLGVTMAHLQDEEAAVAPAIKTYKDDRVRARRSISRLGQESIRSLRNSLSRNSASRLSLDSDVTARRPASIALPPSAHSSRSATAMSTHEASRSTSELQRPPRSRSDTVRTTGSSTVASFGPPSDALTDGTGMREHDSMTRAATRDSAASSARMAAGNSGRTTPLQSITALIPERTSSLSQARRRAKDSARQSSRRAKGKASESGKTRRGRRKASAGDDDVLDELGEEDDTVKRIKQLRQQRQERLAREESETNNNNSSKSQDGAADGDGDGDGHEAGDEGANKLWPRHQERPRRNSATSTSSKPVSATTTPVSFADTTPSRSRPRSSSLSYFSSALPVELPADIPSTVARSAPKASPKASRATSRDRSRGASRDVSRSNVHTLHDGRRPQPGAAPSNPSAMIGLLRQDLTPSGLGNAKSQPVFYNPDGSSSHGRISVESDIEQYMGSRRLNQTVNHSQTGRIISFSEVGDPRGHAVFVCVGMGLTRFVSAFYDDLARTLNLRLITPDRPGVGDSGPYGERDVPGPMSWHQDVATICQHLGITSFSLLAHSAGAVFALATALSMPRQVVGKIYLLAPWIPPSQYETSLASDPNVRERGLASTSSPTSLPPSQRILRIMPTSILRAVNSSFLSINSGSNGKAAPQKRESPSPNRRQPLRRVDSRNAASELTDSAAEADPDLPLPSDLLPSPISAYNPAHTDVNLSATAYPTDTDLVYANSHLHAAQHAIQHHERQRQVAFSTALVHRIWSASTRNSNPANDLLVCLERSRPVGFRYVDVRKPVVAIHGSEDKRVRADNVRWMIGRMNAVRQSRREQRTAGVDGSRPDGAKLGSPLDPRNMWKGGSGHGVGLTQLRPNGTVGIGNEDYEVDHADADADEDAECELRVLDGQGHGLMASASVMGDVLSEMAIECGRAAKLGRRRRR